MRREFSASVKRKMVERATNKRGEICCEGCGLVLAGKPHEFDHTIAEELIPDWKKAEKLTANDGKLLGRDCCHRGTDGKTKKDVAQIAKAKRQANKNSGIKRAKQKIESRNDLRTEPKARKIDKGALAELPRRPLFREIG